MKDFLKGKKTYIVAVAMALVGASYGAGLIDEDTMKTLLALLNASGLATMSAKVNHVSKSVDNNSE